MNNIDHIIREARAAGRCFELARNTMRYARRHQDDKQFVSTMVRYAREMNRLGVYNLQLARKWLS